MYKLILALSFMGLISCNSNNQATHIAVLKKLDSTLQNTNDLAEYGTIKAFRSLNEKLKDYCSAERAKEIIFLADSINHLSRKNALFIEDMKSDFRKDAGFSVTKNNNYEIEINKKVVGKFFVTKGNGKELFNRIKSYKIGLINMDSNVTAEFKTEIQSLPENFGGLINISDVKEWDEMNVQSALLLLSDLRTQIQLLNSKIITYLDKRVGCFNDFNYYKFSIIVVPSSSIIFSGEKLEINAGVGSFSNQANADIEINHKQIKASNDGVATYKFKVPSNPGKYLVPVKIKYKDPNTGKDEFVEREVEYEVIPKSN